MKKLTYLLIASSIVLTACDGSAGKLSFHATFGKNVEAARASDLARIVSRVITRRVEAMEGKVADVVNTLTEDGTDISFTVTPTTLVKPLTEQLESPFTFRLMRAAKPGETPTITFSEKGGYVELGVTEKDVLWLEAGTDEKTKKGNVLILFTEQGKARVKTAMSQTKGMIVALVVRNQLVSTFQSQGLAKENIAIEGVPSPELAAVFADDVNVGVHVTFVKK